MAEKPRLKKSNEILGSINPEPARSKRGGGRMPDKDDGQAGRGQDAKPKRADDDYFEEDIELNDAPTLPSAQSLAEKLLPKKTPRTRNFSAFEPEDARTGQRPEPEPKPERKTPGAQGPAAEPPPAEIEFVGATPSKDTVLSVEFQAAPAPSRPAAIEFGADASFNAAPPNPPPPQPRSAAAKPQQRGQSRTPDPAPPPSAVREFEAAPAPTITEYTFQSFEEPKAAESTATIWEFSTQDENEPNRRRAKQGPEERGTDVRQEPLQPQSQPQPRRERIIRPLRTENAQAQEREPQSAEQQAAFSFEPLQAESAPPEPPRKQAPPSPPEPEISETERNRQDFLKRIASQFEVQFEEKFGDGALKPRDPLLTQRENLLRDEPSPRRERSAPREPLFSPEPPVPLDDQIEGEDFLSYVQRQERERKLRMNRASVQQAPPPEPEREDEPVLGFIERFEKDIREEEHQRSEDFKETLSQKFMRERERYLRELDIGGDEPGQPVPEPEPPPPSAAPTRRKLDFQIQPEMHMQNGSLPHGDLPHGSLPQSNPPNPRPRGGAAERPSGPVTYTRGGTVRPQTPAEGDDTGAAPPAKAPAAGNKKTGEQLLMEHSMRTRAHVPAAPQPQPAKLKFTFETPEEHDKKAKDEKESLLPTEKWPRRIVFIAMAAGLFSLGLVIWSMVSYYNLSSGLAPAPGLTDTEPLPVAEDTLDIYNDRVFTQTVTVDNVIFKNAGTLLKNAHVKEYVVIEGVEGAGRIRLEDVDVDSAVSVKAGGVDTLELHNVKAARVIINNPQAGMTVNATGNTSIDVVELRTKATVVQSDIGADFEGIHGMVVTSPESGGEVDARLDGLDLRTLETEAGTAILAFANNTRAEIVSADGSLSLSGDGKISTLSIGSKIGQGAGDTEDRKDVILFVKGVSISNLNVKSPATLNLSTTIDSISTADAITLGGEASVGTFTLNPRAGASSRLLIDIVSATIQSVYSNTQSRINVTGASRINELTADESTYVLGNKVNHLKVNADGVIYENEPDKITVASGVKPPQSKADNPNIDYNLGTAPQTVTDVTDEDFATTCGHSRESGGFLLGDGSKDAPYEVSTAMQLAHVGSHLASHFIQTDDIDLSAESAVANNFPIIGGAESPFEGVFDGRGFAVARLKIVSQAENIGLFGANKGTIQNVRLYSGDISAASASPGFAGGIAGLNYDGGQIRSCSNGASINGNQNTRTGGIAGGNYGGRIHDCYNYAKIAGVDVAGGIVGLNRQGAAVTGSYNAGIVDGRDYVGAVAGMNEDGTVANCYFLEDTSFYGIGSGSGTATEKTAEELASSQMAADLSAGNENSLWTAGSATGGYAYPVHRKPE